MYCRAFTLFVHNLSTKAYRQNIATGIRIRGVICFEDHFIPGERCETTRASELASVNILKRTTVYLISFIGTPRVVLARAFDFASKSRGRTRGETAGEERILNYAYFLGEETR